VHPYVPALEAQRVQVRKKSDDPIENMMGVKVVQEGREKSQNPFSGSDRIERYQTTDEV
jgi:hypothetical protein